MIGIILSTIDKCHYNGEIIGRTHIFNGIFSYEREMRFKPRIYSDRFIEQLTAKNGYINHICFDDNIFMRYWVDGNPIDRPRDNRRCYSFYDLSYSKVFNEPQAVNPGLAYGYFISNLLETVYRLVTPNVLNDQYFEFLYPLENTKEVYRITGCEIKLQG